jgi:hydrogenase maturation protein HypF
MVRVAGSEYPETLKTARKILIQGIVQGVGFRPHVYRLAQQWGLRGTVGNDARGVVIVAEGDDKSIQSFMDSILAEAPPLAAIDSVDATTIPLRKFADFTIAPSNGSADPFTLISPDVTICGDCLDELFDPGDRRYRYPFINCTNCGPRFTIITDIPYDRPNTTMSSFTMCDDCAGEYNDPANRRFHAQPNACPSCGPGVSLRGKDLQPIAADDAIARTGEILKEGGIVAVKGLGGYHLACDATDDNAVKRLRERKRRIEKPFAVMVPDIEWLEKICLPSADEREFLESIQRPIVLIQRKTNSLISKAIAPGNDNIGVMLPYTPLHHLLLREAGIPLVMTSGNISEEPIAYTDADAFGRLIGIADYYLTHNRGIHMRCDDSVGAVLGGRKTMLRRARGYVPYPFRLSFRSESPVLAAGGHLKNTFCLIRNDYAFFSHHIGDLENFETLESFTGGIEHFKNLFSIQPGIIAYDMHPEYLSTKYALERDVPVKIPVQHHHAHVASCMAENGIDGDVIGIAFDGTGYGTDGAIWGGEFLTASYERFERAAHFKYFPLPGGEQAVREPWRTGFSLLYSVFGGECGAIGIPFMESLSKKNLIPVLQKMIDRRINSPLTSAAGRLFDGIAALCGIRENINYEAQAAIEFQMLADKNETGLYRYDLDTSAAPWKIIWGGIVKEVVNDIRNNVLVSAISGKFHNTIAEIIADTAVRIGKDTGMKNVILTGGVFQNALLVEKTVGLLAGSGLRVYTHGRIPPNDGGLALGQAAIAARLHKRD